MPEDNKPSFSAARKWSIGFSLLARTALVVAVVGMVNYLGAQFPHRFYLSAKTRIHLSPRTMNVLEALTNKVTVTLYYDMQDKFYPDIESMLEAYRNANRNITVRTVDYNLDRTRAQDIKQRYGLGYSNDRNLIIFDIGGRFKVLSGEQMLRYGVTGVSKDRKLEFSPVAYNSELFFTSALLALENAKPLKAYFLTGDGEGLITDTGDYGFSKFAALLAQNYIAPANLDLSGVAAVPADCDLLVIAAPVKSLPAPELDKIEAYLDRGGRLLMLFNFLSVGQPTGLEPLLKHWGVIVGDDYVKDIYTITGDDVKVSRYGDHPIVASLKANDLALQMIRPRPVLAATPKDSGPQGPKVTELAFSSQQSTLGIETNVPPRAYPLMAAVQQAQDGAAAGGVARIVVVGDSFCFGNYYIQGGANRDFAGFTVNWLVDRPGLLQGIGPRPMSEFRLMLTPRQRLDISWLLLGALPGGVLLLGGIIWMTRRK